MSDCSGAILDVPNGHYILTSNLVNCGVGITARNVDFDLNGFTISVGGGGGSSGVFVSSPGAHIHGGTIIVGPDAVGIGIFLSNATTGAAQVHVEDMTVSGSYVSGLGVLLFDGQGCLINNTFTNFESGIVLAQFTGQCSGNTIRDNTVTGNVYGIVLSGANQPGWSGTIIGNTVDSNTALGNFGVDLADDSIPFHGGACRNNWKKNTFDTDSEGDGPGAGCIQ